MCQVPKHRFTSLEIDISSHQDCVEDELDLDGVMMQSDTDSHYLKINIFVSLGCERTNATVIPVLGWTRDPVNTEHFCIYIRHAEPGSQSGK